MTALHKLRNALHQAEEEYDKVRLFTDCEGDYMDEKVIFESIQSAVNKIIDYDATWAPLFESFRIEEVDTTEEAVSLRCARALSRITRIPTDWPGFAPDMWEIEESGKMGAHSIPEEDLTFHEGGLSYQGRFFMDDGSTITFEEHIF